MSLTFSQRLWLGLYSLVLLLAFPLTLYHLVWRGLSQREYLQRWSERYGRLDGILRLQGAIWIHAVSVGEVNAVQPLIERLLERHPDRPLLVTTITPTGSARVRSLWGDRVHHVYLPFDLRGMVRRFLDHASPALAIIVETEIWLNLYLECRERGIPLMMVNARLSERSLRGYRPVPTLARMAMESVSLVAAQSDTDADRLRALGAPAERVIVTGNLKYDLRVPPGTEENAAYRREHWGGQRPVWVAASTHPPEEAPVLAMHQRYLRTYPDGLLLWAPRHPERFAAVIEMATEAGLRVRSRSQHELPDADTQVFVIDTLGELLGFFACADLAFVGGSLCDVGGHNVLEPAALGVPALVGPHTFNFEEITVRLRDGGALLQLPDAASMGAALLDLQADAARRGDMGEASKRLVEKDPGALAHTLSLIEGLLPKQ